MSATDLPAINAYHNGRCTIFLVPGFIAINRGDVKTDQKWRIAALILSVLFLTCYLLYHFQVGSVPYPNRDWTRPIDFAILIQHVVLADVNVTFIIALV